MPKYVTSGGVYLRSLISGQHSASLQRNVAALIHIDGQVHAKR